MGQNAYRLIQVRSKFSFALSDHPDLREWLSRNSCHESIDKTGAGTIEIEVDMLEEILTELNNPDPKLIASIKKDLAWARRRKDGTILYEIF